jgi:hypothetical protein
MRVPVLVVVPGQEPLRESASASIEGRAPSFGLENAKVPARLELDVSTPAVAMPSPGEGPGAGFESFDPQKAPAFAVRGHIEVDDPGEVPEVVDGQPVFADPRIEPFVTCGGTAALGNFNTVATKLNLAALQAKGLDGSNVAIAIADTGINLAFLNTKLPVPAKFDALNSWTPPGGSTLPGKYPVDHGTMCAFDALIAAPKATLLDFPVLAGSTPGANITGRTISTALLAFAQLMAGWAVAFAGGGLSAYKGLVVSNSWGIYHPSWDFPVGHRGRYIDNPKHPFNLIVGTLAATGVDILFAAGNCGGNCADTRCQGRTVGAIMGANAHQDVLTLAGCDTTDTRVGYSSQGPSIANMFQQKPDLTNYTHFLGSEAFGAGTADSGTSAACPVAAGCVAAIRTKRDPVALPPANLFAQFKTDARPAQSQNGWNGDYGHGIMDPVATAGSLGL